MVKHYVGARYVPKFASPIEWAANTSYEALTIVTFNNASYTSKVPVPPTVGNPANNPQYWALTGNYNAQVEQYRQETETANNILQGNINSEAATRASADSNLQSQINQIVAPSGEAPSAAEVQNARIGADGVTYDTLGNAIRTQVSSIKEDALTAEVVNIFDKNSLTSGVLSISDGQVVVNTNPSLYAEKISLADIGGRDLSMHGVRIYVFVDSNNAPTSNLIYIQQTDVVTVLNANIPANTTDIWVNVYDYTLSWAQLQFNNTITDYMSFGEKAIKLDGVPVSDYPLLTKRSVKDHVVSANYKNLFDSANAPHKQIGNTSIDSKTSLTDNAGFIFRKIPLDTSQDVTFTGVRLYLIADANDYTKQNLRYVDAADIITESSATLKSLNAAYLYVNAYTDKADLVMVQYGSTLDNYMPYGEAELLINNTERVIKDERISNNSPYSSSNVEWLISEKDKELEMLTAEIDRLKENTKALYNIRMNKTLDSKTLTLKGSGERKVILHLHKRANTGYSDNDADVYLPNVEDDFSDIRITDNNGRVLPFIKRIVGSGYDIVADSRLTVNMSGAIKVDNYNRLLVNHDGYVSYSTNDGATWTAIPSISSSGAWIVLGVSQNNTLFLGRGAYLYRCEYSNDTWQTPVLVYTNSGVTAPYFLSTNFVNHPDGELFVATYQAERIIRILKSTDDGLTWSDSLLVNDTYQHVHHLYLDTNQTPVAIYAGCDGGGGIYKTTDKGINWVDLRAQNPNMPQASDYGVIYAESGLRLIGGETPIVGGYSIIKTTDDANYAIVSALGNSVYGADKLGDKLFAIGCGAWGEINSVIMLSEDNGNSWKQIYTTSPLNDDNTASRGFRYITKYTNTNRDDELLIGCQSPSRKPLRILDNGHFAEIIVDVPSGATSITIEDGFIYSDVQSIYNDVDVTGAIVNFPLNENRSFIKELVSGMIFDGNFIWNKWNGKRLSIFDPPILSSYDMYSARLISLRHSLEIPVQIDTSHGITISFWGKLSKNANFVIIDTGETTSGSLIANNYKLEVDGNTCGVYNYAVLPVTYRKYDITIDSNGEQKGYNNGELIYTLSDTELMAKLQTLLGHIANADSIKVLRCIGGETSDCIQHFTIREGVINQSQLYNEYNSYVTDNFT